MGKLLRTVIVPTVFIATVAVLVALVPGVQPSLVKVVWAAEIKVEPAPPENQTYTGAKECASCHFKQFLSWKKTKHADALKLLPEKYQKDAECLKCHTTGFGTPTGFKDIETTPALVGNSCEVCHGPGSKHAEICKAFGKQKLDTAQEKSARDSIWKIIPSNICVECHLTKAHKESATPKELRSK